MTQYQSNMNVAAEPSEDPIAIVGPQYCAPYQMDLTLKRQQAIFSADKYVVKDDNNNIIFNVKEIPFSLHDKKVIFDAGGNPILTLHCKIFSGTWKAFRGESSEDTDLIFTAKGSTILHPNTIFNVYKANNSSKRIPDFKVKGKWWGRSVAIYAGESSTIVAQVQEKIKKISSPWIITVYPNIDHAFVTAMVVLLNALEDMRRRQQQQQQQQQLQQQLQPQP